MAEPLVAQGLLGVCCDYGDGSPVAAISVSCLEDVNPRNLTPTDVDGKNF